MALFGQDGFYLDNMKTGSCVATVMAVLLVCGCGGGGSTEDSAVATGGSDTVSPTILVTAAVGAESVVFTAEVTDNVAVTQVDFVVDGGSLKASASDSRGAGRYSQTVPAASFSAGRHTLNARAYDAAGNVGAANETSFVVPPAINAPIKVFASATKADADVTFTVRIETEKDIKLTNFFLDGEFLGGRGDGQLAYTFARVLSHGLHRFVVDVTDVQGRSAQAEVIVEI